MKEFFRKHFFSVLFLIFALVEAGYIYYMTIEYKKLYEWENSNVHTIDSLIDVINNRNDSIEYKIDTITIQLTNNKNDFKEKFIDISNFSIDSDMVFFSEYVNNFKRRYSDNDNSK